ncbi:MAG: MFS transporter [Hyphomicrobiales bacterium]|nr:MFS transporter [Hyphomicrobiales bacterium]
MSEEKPRKGAWMMVALLFLFMMINFADKAIIGLAGVPIMNELKLSPKQFGAVASSFFFLFSVSAVVTGFLVDRIQSKLALLVMGLIWALVQFPMAGTIGIETLIACRIVLGAGEGPAYPVALHAVYKFFPNSRRPVPSSIIAQGSALGVIIAVPLLNWIITHYSWHHAFGALGVVGMIWTVAWLLLGREGDIVDQPTLPGAEERVPYRHLLFNPTNLASWCTYFAAYFGLALIISWFAPFLIKAMGYSQDTAGKLTALLFAAACVIVFAGSLLSERLMKRGHTSRIARGLLAGLSVCIGGCSLLLAPHISQPELRLAVLIFGLCVPGMIYTLLPSILAEVTPAAQRGAVLAINSAVGTSAGIVAPYLMGSLIEGATSAAAGYQLGFSICGIVMLIGGLIGVAFLRPEAQRTRLAALRPPQPQRA